jgi:hypothetical protein
MEAIFDSRMAAGGVWKFLGIIGQTTNVIAYLIFGLVGKLPFTLDHANRFQISPVLFSLKPIYINYRPIFTDFNFSMFGVNGFMIIERYVFKTILLPILKIRFDTIV